MPYKFPDRYPRSKDSVDIGELNKQFLDMAEALSGNVSEHNIAEGTYTFANTARYSIFYVSQETTIGFGAPSGSPAKHAAPQEETSQYQSNTQLLGNSGGWEPIYEVTMGANQYSRVLQIFSHTCYSWTGYNRTTGGHVYSNTTDWMKTAGIYSATTQPWATPKFQIGIRVNGTIYAATGQRNETHQPHIPIRSFPEVQQSSLSDAYTYDTGDKLAGLWPGMLNLRSEVTACPAHTTSAVELTDLVSVAPGTTKVSIVARRLKSYKNPKLSTDDVIAFLNRSLLIVEYRNSKSRTRAVSAVGVSPIRKGDAVTTTGLNTNTLQKLKTKVDALASGDIKKFNRYHMAKPLRQASNNALIAVSNNVDYGTSPLTVQNRLKGETDNDFAAVGTLTGQTAWTPLTTTSSGSTEFLAILTGANFPTSSVSGVVHITGHIHVQSIKTTASGGALSNTNSEYHMACVGVYYLSGGTRTLITSSVVPLSRLTTPSPVTTYADLATLTVSGNMHVPLMAVLDLSSAQLGSDVQGFGICIATVNWEDATAVEAKVSNASLNVEYYIK